MIADLSELETQILKQIGDKRNLFGVGISEIATRLGRPKEVISRNCSKLKTKGLIQRRSEAFERDTFALVKKKFPLFVDRAGSRSRDPYVWTPKMQGMRTVARICDNLLKALADGRDLKHELWRNLVVMYKADLSMKLFEKGYSEDEALRIAESTELRISSSGFRLEAANPEFLGSEKQ